MTRGAKDAFRRRALDRRPWSGAVRDYDLFKELTVGVVVVGVIILALAGFAGSPDDSSVTLKRWAVAAPADFVATATAELGRTSDTAVYGPPYSTTAGTTQNFGAFDLQSLSGTRIPIDTANDFVIRPLSTDPAATIPLSRWKGASPALQNKWTTEYSAALAKAPGKRPAAVKPGDYGPVPALTGDLLAMARHGSLDGVIQSEGGLYNTNPTATILFLGDGQYFPALAQSLHLTGDQWGMMNETGNYPGQSWLWLFSFWYQIPAIGNLPNADLVIVTIMLALTLALMLVPVIPGLRSIPRWIPVHRLIWRDYYKRR